MKSVRYAVPAAIALIAFAACEDPTNVPFDDAAVTADVAASAGDATASMIEILVGNETNAGGGADIAAGPTTGPNVARPTRVCLDANDAVVANCLPFSSVRKIITSVTISGTRSSTRTDATGATVTWTGTVNRTSNDTTTRVFNGTTETSRIHSGNAVVHDQTTFTDGAFTRAVTEAA